MNTMFWSSESWAMLCKLWNTKSKNFITWANLAKCEIHLVEDNEHVIWH
jgi:hypothetical protein